MFGKGRTKAVTRFAVTPGDGAQSVAVAGDFSDWRPVPMKRQKSGVFVRHVPTPSEEFEYKFVIDGKWTRDPDNPQLTPNPFGTFNSIASGSAEAMSNT